MSENVFTKGLMVPVKNYESIKNDLDAELLDDLYDRNFCFNNEKSLIIYLITEDYDASFYSFQFDGENLNCGEDYFKELEEFGIEIEKDKIVGFQEVWYNGSDAKYWMTTKEEFLKRNKFV